MKRRIVGIGILVLVVGLGLGGASRRQSTTPTVSQPTNVYVALGDSVAAGVGLPDASDSSACGRTNQSYPNQVATKLHYRLRNVACSGATLPLGILDKQDVNQLLVTPQVRQLPTSPKPKLLSITIGANDAHWTTILAKCYLSECGTVSDDAAVSADLATVTSNLSTALTQITQLYDGRPPTIVITGYHQVFPTTNNGCTDLAGIDDSELAWGRKLQAAINSTLQQVVASHPSTKFAAVDFSGHELCTADPWVQSLLDKQPYHPTQAGQAVFAKAVVKAAEETK